MVPSLRINDPIVRFMIGGALIFSINLIFSNFQEDSSFVIRLDEGQIERLRASWLKEKGRAPTDENMKSLIRSEVIEEILFREAQKLGLAEGDRVIKRRMVQKYQFMLDDAAVYSGIDEPELKQHYDSFAKRYQTSGSISFQHIFYSHSRRVDPQGDASQAYLVIRNDGASRPDSDDFPGPNTLENSTVLDIDRLFGSEFYSSLEKLSINQWSPPIESPYGWHLVHISEKTKPYQLSFEASRELVHRDLLALKKEAARMRSLQKTVSKYRIELPNDVTDIDTIEVP